MISLLWIGLLGSTLLALIIGFLVAMFISSATNADGGVLESPHIIIFSWTMMSAMLLSWYLWHMMSLVTMLMYVALAGATIALTMAALLLSAGTDIKKIHDYQKWVWLATFGVGGVFALFFAFNPIIIIYLMLFGLVGWQAYITQLRLTSVHH